MAQRPVLQTIVRGNDMSITGGHMGFPSDSFLKSTLKRSITQTDKVTLK